MREGRKGILVEIPLSCLWEGLVLRDDVYDQTGNVLLLPHGHRMTQKRLEQISNFGKRERYVTTYEETARVILKGKPDTQKERQQLLEEETGYHELKRRAERILHITREAAAVDKLLVEGVISDIVTSLKDVEPAAIFGCIHVPRPIDERLQRHCLNVSFLNGMMGQWLGFPEKDVRNLVLSGLLHDIGKTKIPEEILNAPRKLTEKEFALIRKHPIYSAQLLGNEFDEEVCMAVLHHHERRDGLGYPDRQRGNEIPVFAQITAICDVYDAMISARSYKEAMVPFEVLERVRVEENNAFDPMLVMNFLRNMIKYYRYARVEMSDGTIGTVAYIPPNDIRHPIVYTDELVRQTDELWYCAEVLS